MGQEHMLRALLDNGSQTTFITEQCVQRLGIPRSKSSHIVTGVGSKALNAARGTVQLQFRSAYNNQLHEVDAVILVNITSNLPTTQINPSTLSTTINQHKLDLADPTYHTPRPVDILLGADIYYDLILSGHVQDRNGRGNLYNTTLGWIVAGPMQTSLKQIHASVNLCVENLTEQLKAFWELEDINATTVYTEEEIKCEEHFKETHTRDTDGRFVVELPFKTSSEGIGNSQQLALKRLLQIEHRLKAEPSTQTQYCEFMQEYLDLKHMEPTPESSLAIQGYHLPHHCIIRKQATSTKLRVVFDGSALSTCGMSLNQTLMVGPTLQDDVVDIITRFRVHNVVYVADIAMMYRQILVHPKHRRFQRVLWRTTTDQQVQDYQLCTVTYGTTSAPYLAIRCLKELAKIGQKTHPMAAAILNRDFYVDDVMSGADTIELARQTQLQLIELLRSAGFNLHKWTSNKPELLNQLHQSQCNPVSTLLITENAVKTLGINWNTEKDYFAFKICTVPLMIVTKRTILASIAKLFDPLGWIAPVIIVAKLLIQQLWLDGCGWDDQLPVPIVHQWKKYEAELPLLVHLQIPRKMILNSINKVYQLHGYCDASEQAYGAVIYARSTNLNKTTSHLVCSKSRVAPLKRISLPRLELCAAVLLSKLMKRLRNTLGVELQEIFAWTDSMIVLAWLQKQPNCWKTFVANRVTEIQANIPPSNWKHVKSEDNPADCLSRGITSIELQKHHLWWNGPPWLQHDAHQWPNLLRGTSGIMPQVNREIRTGTRVAMLSIQDDGSLLTKFSSLSKLMRITAFCLRFIHNCKLPIIQRKVGPLNTTEVQEGLNPWIRRCQLEQFESELNSCINNKPLCSHSKLNSLNPFLDSNNLLRVGGRIDLARINYNQRHPIILSQHHNLSVLIIQTYHVRYLHAGALLLHNILRQQYWIIGARNAIRKVIHQCLPCFRLKATTAQQLMGTLPSHRVRIARPFFQSGVDYAGPILIKSSRTRGRPIIQKAYICIFICFATRAIHIELASDLTTATFIAALRRFIARRGKPADIYSDCGSNFIGANHELESLQKLMASTKHNRQVLDVLANEGTNWHFSPPVAPHFGGLWEAGVKSIKHHLRRTVGLTLLTYEELYTIIVQIESCLNSRPLCAISNDPNDYMALTLGHFLIGDALTAMPDESLHTSTANRLTHWKLVQKCYPHF